MLYPAVPQPWYPVPRQNYTGRIWDAYPWPEHNPNRRARVSWLLPRLQGNDVGHPGLGPIELALIACYVTVDTAVVANDTLGGPPSLRMTVMPWYW